MTSIPTELLEQPRWVCWRAERRAGKTTKVPRQPNGMAASSTDPTTWADFDTCLAAAGGTLDMDSQGVGFVLGDGDLIGIDLDNCRDPSTGALEGWADELVDELDSYAEESPSGAGVHVWLHAAWDERGRRNGKLEAYREGRYLTITGRRLPGAPETVERRDEAFGKLRERHFGPPTEPLEAPPERPPQPRGDDAEIVSYARAAKNGDKFARLYDHGDLSGHESHSHADLALCSLLAFWTGDPAQLDRVFRTSALFRSKWDERRGRLTYGERTIAKALSGGERPPAADPPPAAAPGAATANGGSRASDADDGLLPVRSVAELMDSTADEPLWLVEGMIAPETQCLFFGPPKVGKSTFMFRLLAAMNRGESVLGLDARQVTYLLLSEEGSLTLKSKFFRFDARTDRSHVFLLRDVPHTEPWTTVAHRAIRTAKRLGHELLVIDTLGSWAGLRGESENHAGAVLQAMQPLQEAVAAGLSVVVVHHARKSGGAHGEGVRGSSAFAGIADVLLELSRVPGAPKDSRMRSCVPCIASTTTPPSTS